MFATLNKQSKLKYFKMKKVILYLTLALFITTGIITTANIRSASREEIGQTVKAGDLNKTISFADNDVKKKSKSANPDKCIKENCNKENCNKENCNKENCNKENCNKENCNKENCNRENCNKENCNKVNCMDNCDKGVMKCNKGKTNCGNKNKGLK